jgi:hypothetical protein
MSKSFRTLLILSAGFSVLLAYQNFTPSQISSKPSQSDPIIPGMIYHNGAQLALENRTSEVEKEIVMSVNKSYKRKIDYQEQLNNTFTSACSNIKVGVGVYNRLSANSKLKPISAGFTLNSSQLVNQKDDKENYSHFKYRVKCHQKDPVYDIAAVYPKFRSPADNKHTLIFFPQVSLEEFIYNSIIERKIGFKLFRTDSQANGLNEKSKAVIAAADEACKSISHSVGYNVILGENYGYRDVSMNLEALQISKPFTQIDGRFVEKTFTIKCGRNLAKDKNDQ